MKILVEGMLMDLYQGTKAAYYTFLDVSNGGQFKISFDAPISDVSFGTTLVLEGSVKPGIGKNFSQNLHWETGKISKKGG